MRSWSTCSCGWSVRVQLSPASHTFRGAVNLLIMFRSFPGRTRSCSGLRLRRGTAAGLAGDDRHFDEHAGQQVGPDRGAYRLGGPGEMLLVAGVELIEQGEIPDVHQARDDVLQTGPGRAQEGFDVAEHLR